MFNGLFNVPAPANEAALSYAPHSPERAELKSKLAEMLDGRIEVPMIIGGKEVTSGHLAAMRCPHDHRHELGAYHQGNALHVEQAIQAASEAKSQWGGMLWDSRATVFLKAVLQPSRVFGQGCEPTLPLRVSAFAHGS